MKLSCWVKQYLNSKYCSHTWHFTLQAVFASLRYKLLKHKSIIWTNLKKNLMNQSSWRSSCKETWWDLYLKANKSLAKNQDLICLLPENLCPNALRKSFRGCDASGALYPNFWLSSAQCTGFQLFNIPENALISMPEQQRHKVGYFHIQKSVLQRKRLLSSNLLRGSLRDYLSIYSLNIKTHPRSFLIALAFKVQIRRHSSFQWKERVIWLIPKSWQKWALTFYISSYCWISPNSALAAFSSSFPTSNSWTHSTLDGYNSRSGQHS